MIDDMTPTAIPLSFLRHPVHFCSLGFGSGLSPRAPGTFGSLVGVVLYLGLQFLPLAGYLVVTGVICASGIWFCDVTARALGVHDHPAIVWDEIAGILVTMIHAPSGWQWIVLGFLLFRIFDIFKPWPISLLDKRVKGGTGIMLDDMVAGFFSLICLQIIHYLL